MAIRDVKESFSRVTADRKIDVKDVDTILQSAGSISVDEQKEIQTQADKFAGMMEPGAAEKLRGAYFIEPAEAGPCSRSPMD